VLQATAGRPVRRPLDPRILALSGAIALPAARVVRARPARPSRV